MLVFSTQVFENYGTEDEPYWKAKGGGFVKVMDVPQTLSREAINGLCHLVETNDPMYTEHVVDWFFREDDWLSPFEDDQLERDELHIIWEPVVQYEDLVNDLINC